uniref:Uncharacterized protein n=1 Tax=Alexandrium monilatum TaxID=311494 RepID=A0A7S4PUM1_9DINO
MGPGRSARRAAAGMRRLECVLRHLCALLALVSKEDRRAALDTASSRLRARLLAFMEARKSGRACQPRGAGGGPANAEQGGGAVARKASTLLRDVDEELSEEETLLALENVAAMSNRAGMREAEDELREARQEPPDDGAVPLPPVAGPDSPHPAGRRALGPASLEGAREGADSGFHRKNVRFPGIYMRAGWRQDFYVAAAGLENFTIFSRNVRTLEEAVNHHIALLQVKRALEASSKAAGSHRPFRERLAAALREVPPLDGLQPSFYTVLTCARLFGAKKIRSPATVDLQEALDHHQRLTEARRLGHAALRAAWSEVLQVERIRKAGARGNAIKRPRTREEAEAVVAGAERAATAWRNSRADRAAAQREARARKAAAAGCPGSGLGMPRAGCHQSRGSRRLAKLRWLLARAERLLVFERRRELEAIGKQRAAARRAAEQERSRRRLARRLAAQRRREELRARERQWRARRTWLRSGGRQRTFAEEQQGPPAS